MKHPIDLSEKFCVIKNKPLTIWLQDIQKYKVLSAQEEEEVICRYKNGDRDAFDIIVQSNQRFIYKMAKYFTKNADTILDLISEGNLGLLDAIERYDLTRGIKFMSYAVWYIRRNMQEYFYRNGLVKHYVAHGTLAHANRIKKEWFQEYGFDIPLEILRDKVNEGNPKRVIRDKMFFSDVSVKMECDHINGDDEKYDDVLDRMCVSRNNCEVSFDREDEMARVERYLNAVCASEVERGIMVDKYGLFGNEQLGEASLCMKYNVESWYITYLNHRLMEAMNTFAKTGVAPKRSRPREKYNTIKPVKEKKKGVSVSAKAQVSVKKKEKATPKCKTNSVCGS